MEWESRLQDGESLHRRDSCHGFINVKEDGSFGRDLGIIHMDYLVKGDLVVNTSL